MDVLNITGYQRRTPHVVGNAKASSPKNNLSSISTGPPLRPITIAAWRKGGGILL